MNIIKCPVTGTKLIKTDPHFNSKNKQAGRVYIYDDGASGFLGEFWGAVCRECTTLTPKSGLVHNPKLLFSVELYCKHCQKEYMTTYNKKNQKEIVRKKSEYHKVNKDYFNALSREYREKNPDRVKKSNDNWYKEFGAEYAQNRRKKYSNRSDEELLADRDRLRPEGKSSCRSCKKWLPFSSFSVNRANAAGLSTSCKPCKVVSETKRYRKVYVDYWLSIDIPLQCVYCSGDFQDVDHITPLVSGGEDVPYNTAPSCARCNRSKNNKSVEDWYPRHAEKYGLTQTMDELSSTLRQIAHPADMW